MVPFVEMILFFRFCIFSLTSDVFFSFFFNAGMSAHQVKKVNLGVKCSIMEQIQTCGLIISKQPDLPENEVLPECKLFQLYPNNILLIEIAIDLALCYIQTHPILTAPLTNTVRVIFVGVSKADSLMESTFYA